MQPKKTVVFIDEPLPGCDKNFIAEGNYQNLVSGIVLNLSLCYKNGCAGMILKTIEEESCICGIDNRQYCLNELQYEYRRILKLDYDKVKFEYKVLHKWCKLLMKKYSSDEVLDFVSKVKNNREIREMVF